MKNKISVTIATYKRPLVLTRVINMLENQTLDYINYEVIICDSNSCEETAELIKKVKNNNPRFDLVHVHTRNILAAKRNIGISTAKYPIVLFMDDDCIPASADYLEQHLKCFEDENSDFSIMCGEVRFPQEWVKASNYYRFRDEEGFLISKNKIINLDFRTIVVMNMSFRRDKFLEHIGYVNEEFVGYGMEDQELGWRLQNRGFKIYGICAKILHNEMSDGIEGYGLKIYHTARDGSTTLLRVCPEAFAGIRILKIIDKDYPFPTWLEKYFFKLARLFMFPNFGFKVAKRIAHFTENIPMFYLKPVYRYVLACYYIIGVRDRDIKLCNPENGWFN